MNGRPGMNSSHEKVKDFKNTILRLIKELKGYRILISFALVLAILGSVLSIIAPNKLSSLTNEIQVALEINNENLVLANNFQKEQFELFIQGWSQIFLDKFKEKMSIIGFDEISQSI